MTPEPQTVGGCGELPGWLAAAHDPDPGWAVGVCWGIGWDDLTEYQWWRSLSDEDQAAIAGDAELAQLLRWEYAAQGMGGDARVWVVVPGQTARDRAVAVAGVRRAA